MYWLKAESGFRTLMNFTPTRTRTTREEVSPRPAAVVVVSLNDLEVN